MALLAAEMGVKSAGSFFAMTPREVFLTLSAHRARQERAADDRWLLSRYMALAFHAPDRLPSRPSRASACRDMTDEEMKQRLLSWRGKE